MSFVDLVHQAIAVGRAAQPSRLHTDHLAAALGVATGIRAAVGLHVDDGIADFVAHLDDAEVLVVRTGPDSVAEIEAHGLARFDQPGLWDDGRHRVMLPGALQSRPADVAAAVARAAILRAADAVGAASAALDAAVEHVTTREQFGAPLGALQAVQHRCADMLSDVTIANDAVLDSAARVDGGAAGMELQLGAAFAQATAIERCRRVTAAAHQLAGGQGILADAPYHRWYRRAKVAEAEFGSVRSWRALIAASVLDSPS